jgi:hypothetical protein
VSDPLTAGVDILPGGGSISLRTTQEVWIAAPDATTGSPVTVAAFELF